jgi:predicted nucleic acid-binding protein
MKAVIDASAALHIVMDVQDGASLLPVLQRCELIMAPALYPIEVANGLWRSARAGMIEAGDVDDLLTRALALVDTFQDCGELINEAAQEALRLQHPVYDLVYFVLARRNAAALITRDQRLFKLAAGEGLTVLFEG